MVKHKQKQEIKSYKQYLLYSNGCSHSKLDLLAHGTTHSMVLQDEAHIREVHNWHSQS